MCDWHYNFPISAEIYTLLVVHLNSACNPVFYATYNANFRHGYVNVLRCIFRIKKKPEHLGQTSTVSPVGTINMHGNKSTTAIIN